MPRHNNRKAGNNVQPQKEQDYREKMKAKLEYRSQPQQQQQQQRQEQQERREYHHDQDEQQ